MGKTETFSPFVISTLAVGTEITDGQISDRNSQWLSSRLVEMGAEVREHRAIPDDIEHIKQSLSELLQNVQILFVTGGLGPTSDDFTRECVAMFAGAKLQWSAETWNWIVQKLESRGSPVTENQRQQCYFPAGAEILHNSAGTAHGFQIKVGDRLVVCLPGPPSEIEAIWEGGLRAKIDARVRDHFKTSSAAGLRELTLIRTMGLGEGALAYEVEVLIDQALGGNDVARPIVGYRAHAPYVEIKLWANETQKEVVAKTADAIRTKFHNIIVNEGDADIADGFLVKLFAVLSRQERVVVFDRVTDGGLHRRLVDRARETKSAKFLQAINEACVFVIGKNDSAVESVLSQSPGTLIKTLEVGSHERELILRTGKVVEVVDLPKLATRIESERGRKWAIEHALLKWGRPT